LYEEIAKLSIKKKNICIKEAQMYRKLVTHSRMSLPKAWTSISDLKSSKISGFDKTQNTEVV